jgi:NAD(P)-dependent dehydrogenase (short-subunit alcohol dehydrogenase family)
MAEGRLADKVAVVTGGASGIGAATVRCFVAEGASVLVADLNGEAAAVLVDELGSAAAALVTNVAVEADMAATVAEAADRFGGLDIYVNNAGFGGALGPIAETPVEDFDLTFDVLVKSVFLGIKYAAPVLCRQGHGVIINTASIAGLRSGWGPHLYSTAKSAVISLTQSVALELAAAGVRCNAVAPGLITTSLAFGRPDASDDQLAAMRVTNAAAQPMPRAGEPADIASMMTYLASDEADWITGQVFVVDGGINTGPRWEQFPPAFTRHRPIRHHRPPGR